MAYYLGGQINCSTTIHSYTDILRILSLSDDPSEEDEQDRPKTSKALKQRKNPFRFLLGDRKYKLDVRETGMEHGLLKKIEKMSLGSQMKLFYTAYSKVPCREPVRLRDALTVIRLYSTWSCPTRRCRYRFIRAASWSFCAG